MNRIHSSLQRSFERHRLVFWYDAAGEWMDAFESFEDDVVRLRVEGNEFGAKVQIARAPDTRFLVYVPAARPADGDNWLLDLLLQGHEFRADKASLVLEDVGLPHGYRHLVVEHAPFFNSAKRAQALQDLIGKDDDVRDVRLKMMAVLAGTAAEIDAILLHFLGRGPAGSAGADPVEGTLGTADLVGAYWREVERLFGYSAPVPSLRDFAVSLFRGANPLDPRVQLHPHGKVFLRRWQDSQRHRDSYRTWANQLQDELQITAALDAAEGTPVLGEWDTFEVFERFTLHRLSAAFAAGAPAVEIRATIEARRLSFWYPAHEDGYLALEHAIVMREALSSAELAVESLADGVRRYRASWWQIDRSYRRCAYHLRRYGQIQVMGPVSAWVERAYVNNFLLPLSDRWGDQVASLTSWDSQGLLPQRRFFETYVQPFRDRGQKVFVIVSDALRYEVAAEFTERLLSANRWEAELEAVLGSLPSYTQLGMAALMPGREWAVDPVTATVTVDGKSASGTAGRAGILSRHCDGAATALQAEDFLSLNTKTEGRALMRDHNVIYIFHNRIDSVGDDLKTEGKTLEAVEQAFDELDQLIKKVANINGTNMLLTADHGFLFQQEAVVDADMTALPEADEWTNRNRRFAIGRGITPSPGVKVFSASALGLVGDWSVAFPLSLGRFPLQGSGKRFVHGGISLQEVLVPVVRIHKARTDDTTRVSVDLLRVPAKITTGQLSVVLYQERPVAEKVLPRTLRLGVFAKDGTVLSEVRTITFDTAEMEARLRETTVLVTLSHEADAYNNQEVELRLEETIPGTSQTVTYRKHGLKLQKPFASDFDEF